jgi:hypothetical protein
LFSWGENNDNQKGINGKTYLEIPTKVEFFKNIEIENVFTGFRSTFVKTKSNLKLKKKN